MDIVNVFKINKMQDSAIGGIQRLHEGHNFLQPDLGSPNPSDRNTETKLEAFPEIYGELKPMECLKKESSVKMTQNKKKSSTSQSMSPYLHSPDLD